MSAAVNVVAVLEVYAWVGLALCIAFLGFGIDRVAPSARGSYVFRVLLIPGVMLLWPIVAVRWWLLERGLGHWRANHTPRRRLHGRAWMLLAVVIPAVLIVSFMVRQNGPLERPAVQLDPAPGSTAEGDSR